MREYETLEEFVRERMRRTRLPGVSLALVRGDEVVYARGFGFRDLEKKLPATPATAYGIGSITKSFTALAILQLAEEGKLSLDDPVEKFLPLKIRPFGEPIRIWHLLTHTAGVPALAYAEAELRWEQGTGGRPLALATVEDFLAWLNGAADWVEARPGQRWFYLNEGYILLGGIMEKLSGLAYADYVRKRILGPLGMTSTGFLGEDVPELATPYVVPAEGQPKPGKIRPIPIGSDG
ncbi:MAG: serine hydrolase domain-containing protein, partial [Candidatus Bipolaricaulaceae bacterium]